MERMSGGVRKEEKELGLLSSRYNRAQGRLYRASGRYDRVWSVQNRTEFVLVSLSGFLVGLG